MGSTRAIESCVRRPVSENWALCFTRLPAHGPVHGRMSPMQLTLALVRLSSARRFTVSAANQSLGYRADDMFAALLVRELGCNAQLLSLACCNIDISSRGISVSARCGGEAHAWLYNCP